MSDTLLGYINLNFIIQYLHEISSLLEKKIAFLLTFAFLLVMCGKNKTVKTQ